MSLRARVAIVAAAAVALAVIAVSTGAFVAARSELRSQVDASLLQRATIVEAVVDRAEEFVAAGEWRRLRASLVGNLAQNDFDVVYYQFNLPNGDVVKPLGQPILPAVEWVTTADGPVWSDDTVSGVHIRMVGVDAGRLGVVQIARPLTEVDAALRSLARILIAVGIIGTGLAGVIGLIVARNAIKPIEDLTRTAEHVAETRDLGSRIEVDSEDELGSLARSFNAMLAALDESRSQQRRLVRDAGHELKTPLTALRTNIELLAKSENLTEDMRDELVAAAEAEVIDLSALVTEIVDLASDRYAELPIEPVALDDVVELSVAKARRRGESEVDLTRSPSPVMGRPAALERAVDNLLDNAQKWNETGNPIEVEVSDGRVAVRDHGPGIPSDEQGLIFDRFYRSVSARSGPGSGLGLSIVKQVAEDHGGSVFVEAAPDGGAIVGFTIPVASA
jgi:two-component system, OmpR family, sensor histidine kinase MprB